MVDMKTIRRVTVYAAGGLEQTLVTQCLALGSRGYTVTNSRGKGEHGNVQDPFGPSSHVRIEFLVQPDVADKIMTYLKANHFTTHGVTACVDNVDVARSEKY